jgi:hypothetical protein
MLVNRLASAASAYFDVLERRLGAASMLPSRLRQPALTSRLTTLPRDHEIGIATRDDGAMR